MEMRAAQGHVQGGAIPSTLPLSDIWSFQVQAKRTSVLQHVFSPPFSLSPFSDPLFNFRFNPTLCSGVPCCLREKSVFALISSSRPTAHEWLFHLALLASGF